MVCHHATICFPHILLYMFAITSILHHHQNYQRHHIHSIVLLIELCFAPHFVVCLLVALTDGESARGHSWCMREVWAWIFREYVCVYVFMCVRACVFVCSADTSHILVLCLTHFLWLLCVLSFLQDLLFFLLFPFTFSLLFLTRSVLHAFVCFVLHARSTLSTCATH